MHYRDVPTQRPIHTFEQVSYLPRFSVIGPVMMLVVAASVALFSITGADLYCTRNQDGRPACELHTHFPARTTVARSTEGRRFDPEVDHDHDEPLRHDQLGPTRRHDPDNPSVGVNTRVPENPLVFDARFYRDTIDGPVRRGRWERSGTFFDAARAAFVAGQSPGFTVRDRRKNGIKADTVSVGLPIVAALISIAIALTRRRYRLRFDGNSDTVWLSHGTLVRMSPEREVRLPPKGSLAVKMTNDGVTLAPVDAPSTALFSSPFAQDYALFDSLARCVAQARGPIKTVASPLPTALYALNAVIVGVAALAVLVPVLSHTDSLPSAQATIALRASSRCSYGGVSLLPGGAMQWSVPAGVHTLSLTDDTARTVPVTVSVAPDTTTTIECSPSLFAPAAR
jgi:hypothetical protein